MNGAHRPRKRMSYRQRIYRRRKIKYIIALSALALAVLFVIFLIIGNILDRKVESTIAGLDDLGFADSGKVETDAAYHKTPASYTVKPTALSASGSSLESRLAALKSNAVKAACFELDTESGALLYASSVARSLGYQSAEQDLWHLENAIAKFDANGLYSVGITYASGLDDSSDLSRTAAIGYHSALIAEALRVGVDEVLIIAPKTDAESSNELIRIADEVHRLVPDGKIGLALSYPLPEIPDSDNEFSDELLVSLWEAFDFFALDICDGISTVDEAELRAGELLYYVLRYNMRILIPSDNDALAADLTRMCEQRGFNNIQIMP